MPERGLDPPADKWAIGTVVFTVIGCWLITLAALNGVHGKWPTLGFMFGLVVYSMAVFCGGIITASST